MVLPVVRLLGSQLLRSRAAGAAADHHEQLRPWRRDRIGSRESSGGGDRADAAVCRSRTPPCALTAPIVCLVTDRRRLLGAGGTASRPFDAARRRGSRRGARRRRSDSGAGSRPRDRPARRSRPARSSRSLTAPRRASWSTIVWTWRWPAAPMASICERIPSRPGRCPPHGSRIGFSSDGRCIMWMRRANTPPRPTIWWPARCFRPRRSRRPTAWLGASGLAGDRQSRPSAGVWRLAASTVDRVATGRRRRRRRDRRHRSVPAGRRSDSRDRRMRCADSLTPSRAAF